MGVQRSEEGSEVGVEVSATTPSSILPTKIVSAHLRVCSGDVVQGCDKTVPGSGGSEPSLFCSEGRNRQEKDGSGLIGLERGDCVSHIQDGIGFSGSPGPAIPGLANFDRPLRLILAYSDSSVLSEIPVFRGRRRQVRFQCHAFRPEHCPKNLHEDLKRPFDSVEDGGHSSFRLPRRLVSGRQDTSRVVDCHPTHSGRPDGVRVSDKLQEVVPSSVTIPEMAGLALGYSGIRAGLSSGLSSSSLGENSRVRKPVLHDKKGSREDSRVNKFHQSARSYRENSLKSCQLLAVKAREALASRLGLSRAGPSGVPAVPLVRETDQRPPSALGETEGICLGLLGRLKGGLGLPHVDRSVGRGSVVASGSQLPHQHPRVLGGVLSAEGPSLAKGHFHRPNVGQHDSGQLSKKRRFFEVSDSQQLDSQGGCSRSREGVVPRSYSCEGVDERLGGHSVKILPDLHRVDGGRPILSVASRQPSDPVSSGRPVRLAFQREVTELRFSSGSTRRYRGRRLHGKLGQVGSSLSFPPSSSSFKSHQSPNPLQGEGGVACTLVARQTLVSSSSGPVPSTSGVPRPDPSSESEGQRVLCPVLLDLQASYLDFLRRSWNLKFDEEVANALCSALRESSYRQYSSVWKKFQCFVISRWPCKIDENLVLKFFLFQFKNFNLSSRTIACYRSALSEPMKVGFGIELQKAVFSRLLRSFFLSRPPRQFSEPAWNLDLVLDLLCTPPFKTNISMVNLTLKTIFLVALALGCRASELHSLLRSPRYIVFSRNFKSVKIIPNPSFLCKNESLNFRRQPMILQAMMQRDGSHHTLCPVAALRKYLNVTKRFNGRGLFFNPVTRVPCNAARINYYVKFLVRKSQPNVYASFHDLRHFAAWRAFWSGMSYSGMRARGFWKSNSSLQKSYLAGSTPSSTPCVALGVVCKV